MSQIALAQHPGTAMAGVKSQCIRKHAPAQQERVPVGPPWWGAVMGTGIVSTLTWMHAGNTPVGAGLARGFVIAAWLLMLSFTGVFLVRCLRDANVLRASVKGLGLTAWGMVAMGILSVGSATGTVVSAWIPNVAAAAWAVNGVLWLLGTVIGVGSTFGFVFTLIRHRPETPRPAWGLAIVPPMVSATTGAPFVAQLSSPLLAFGMLTILFACFITSLTLGLVIFAAAYHHHFRIARIPVALAASSWIPLGVVGQSTAAAQGIAGQTARFLGAQAQAEAHTLANLYGVVMLSVAVPLVLFAVVTTVRGFVQRMPFSPGWWALTFPIGTLSLGAMNLGHSTELFGYSVAGAVAWLVLLCTWTLCAAASLRVLFAVAR